VIACFFFLIRLLAGINKSTVYERSGMLREVSETLYAKMVYCRHQIHGSLFFHVLAFLLYLSISCFFIKNIVLSSNSEHFYQKYRSFLIVPSIKEKDGNCVMPTVYKQ